MKTLILLFVTYLLQFTDELYGQCVFNPTITPANIMTCPNEDDTLWTQNYDTYQWYKNGIIIPGANLQYYVVNNPNNVLDTFTVAATLSGCTEMSPAVVVDGHTFASLTVISIGLNGVDLNNLCVGDSVLLILNSPFDSHIQWQNNSVNIPGAINDTLLVTTSGLFDVGAAPSICPNYFEYLGAAAITLTFNSCNTSVPQNFLNNPIQLFPNPAKDRIIITTPQAPSVIEMYDALGEKVYASQNNKSINEINLETYAKGMYLVKTTISNTQYSQRFIKE